MMKKPTAVSAISIESFKSLKYYTFFIKQFFLLFVISAAVKNQTMFKEKETVEILKILGLINNIEEY